MALMAIGTKVQYKGYLVSLYNKYMTITKAYCACGIRTYETSEGIFYSRELLEVL